MHFLKGMNISEQETDIKHDNKYYQEWAQGTTFKLSKNYIEKK